MKHTIESALIDFTLIAQVLSQRGLNYGICLTKTYK